MPVVAAGIAAGASALSTYSTNQSNRDIASSASGFSANQAKKNRRFQRKNIKNSHRRAVKDLKLAGLNPILAAGGGAGGAPGAMGTPTTIPMQSEIDLDPVTAAQVAKLTAETEKVEQETKNAGKTETGPDWLDHQIDGFLRILDKWSAKIPDAMTETASTAKDAAKQAPKRGVITRKLKERDKLGAGTPIGPSRKKYRVIGTTR